MARREQAADLGQVAGGEGHARPRGRGGPPRRRGGRGGRRSRPSAARRRRAAPGSRRGAPRPIGSRRRISATARSHSARRWLYSDVSSLCERAAVADDEPEVRRQRHVPDVERSAVEQDRLPGDAGRRRELVHHPGLDADVAVLGPLAEGRPRARPGPCSPARAAPAPRPSRAPPTTTGRRPAARSRRAGRGTRASRARPRRAPTPCRRRSRSRSGSAARSRRGRTTPSRRSRRG